MEDQRTRSSATLSQATNDEPTDYEYLQTPQNYMGTTYYHPRPRPSYCFMNLTERRVINTTDTSLFGNPNFGIVVPAARIPSNNTPPPMWPETEIMTVRRVMIYIIPQPPRSVMFPSEAYQMTNSLEPTAQNFVNPGHTQTLAYPEQAQSPPGHWIADPRQAPPVHWFADEPQATRDFNPEFEMQFYYSEETIGAETAEEPEVRYHPTY